MSQSGVVFDIQRLSMHDGPGLRTTVFVKGCPLRCKWCHNPESHRVRKEIFVKHDRCLHCGACAAVCKNHAVTLSAHRFDAAACIGCFRCIDACPAGALEGSGKTYTTDEVLKILLRDRAFYEASGGGVTLSGGEVFAQFDFTLELARKCKESGLHVAVETSGYAEETQMRCLAEQVELFLYDLKETDEDKHRAFTGVGLEKIMRNLRVLSEEQKRVILRCPVIPGCNARLEHFRGIARIANQMPCVQEIHVLPYHTLGVNKYAWLERENELKDTKQPSREETEDWAEEIRKHTQIAVLVQ